MEVIVNEVDLGDLILGETSRIVLNDFPKAIGVVVARLASGRMLLFPVSKKGKVLARAMCAPEIRAIDGPVVWKSCTDECPAAEDWIVEIGITWSDKTGIPNARLRKAMSRRVFGHSKGLTKERWV
jgi:hypothetical protein